MVKPGVNFEDYIHEVLKDYKVEPLCPFPLGGECYLTEAERSCEKCEYAKGSYIEKVLDKKKEQRTGARVFCVRCGAGKRTPLRRWHNVYICSECWKILQVIGEEEFIERIRKDIKE